MKAVVYHNYGPPDLLKLEEVEKPYPGDDEILVQINAASLNAGDWHALKGESALIRLMGGIRKPRRKILGDDVAGRVEAVGKNVKQVRPGDEVFGLCNSGGFAEYVSVPKEKWLAKKPPNVSFEEAAAVPTAAITALQGLRDKGQIQPGHKVLINGASGGVGTFAVQIAKSFGADVTAVCSARNLEMARSIGADQVVDYTQEDFTQDGRRYDLILAANGYHPILDYRRALTPEGRYVCTGGTTAQYFQALILGPLLSMTGNKKMGSLGIANPNPEDLNYLIKLVEAGKVAPVIDRCYSLSEVPEALRYLGEAHARGKVVITIEQENMT